MKKLIPILAFLFCSFALAEEFTFKDLSGGMYSFPTANAIPDNAASYIQNFYTDTYNMAEERNGYEKMSATALGSGSDPVTGLWRYFDSDGNEWIISFSSRTFWKNISGNAPTQFGPTQTVDTVPDCATNLGKIWCTDGTDDVWWFDGTSTGAVSSAPKGRLIEPWRTRLAIADVASNRSTIYISEDGDGTSWTAGDLETDPFYKQIGGANDGQYITGVVGSYLDNLVVFRRSDIWFGQGFDQTDLQWRKVSNEVGCIDGRTVQELDGSLLFLSNRGMEKMTGWNIENISEPIRNFTDILVKNTVSERSITQTSYSDFSAGQTTQTVVNYYEGTVSLSTSAATFFVDSTTTDFNGGTLTNLTANTANGLYLSTNATSGTVYSCTGGTEPDGSGCGCAAYQGIKSTYTYKLHGLTVRLSRTSSAITNLYAYLYSSAAGGGVGTQLANLGSITVGDIAVYPSYTDYSLSFTTQTLVANSTYYIYLLGSGCSTVLPGFCSGGVDRWFYTYYTETPCNAYGLLYGVSATEEMNFSLSGSRNNYAPSGNIVSEEMDVGFSTNVWLWDWSTLSATTTTVLGTTTISWGIQTSSDTNGTWTSIFVSTNGSNINATVQRYIRYTATCTTTDTYYSPTISSVSIETSSFIKSTGSFVTYPFTVGSDITSWGPVFFNDNTNGGSIAYQFKSSSTLNFGPTGWTDIVSGQTPSNSTDTYAAIRATFTITMATQAPNIEDLTISWSEGSSPQKASTVYDRRYWLSFTTGTASGIYNDIALIYQRNKSWTLFSRINASSYALFRDKNYFGDSSGNGYIYLFDTGNTDDSNPITSEIRTKSYDMGIPHKEKEFNKLYLNATGNLGYAGSISMYYDIDRSESEYSMGTLALNEGTGNLLTKFPFPASNVIQGRELQYILKKSGTGNRLILDGFITDLTPKEPK